MKIYTKTGDKGDTSLYGGQRVSKSALRVEAYGAVDELNASISLVISSEAEILTKDILSRIQSELFAIGSELATSNEAHQKLRKVGIGSTHILSLENDIDTIDSELPVLSNFILPGGSQSSSLLNLARAVCRRVERDCVKLNNKESINENILMYFNRLSDLLFVLARYENKQKQVEEVVWDSHKF